MKQIIRRSYHFIVGPPVVATVESPIFSAEPVVGTVADFVEDAYRLDGKAFITALFVFCNNNYIVSDNATYQDMKKSGKSGQTVLLIYQDKSKSI